MIFDLDELLEMVDGWKRKLHEKLKKMSPKQKTVFRQQSMDRARTWGLPVVEMSKPRKRQAKRQRRATG